MASESKRYSATEVDQKLAELKDEMIAKVNSAIVMNDGDAPSTTDTLMWLQVNKKDTVK